MRHKKIDWYPIIAAVLFGVIALSFAHESRADAETLWLTTGEWSTHNNQEAHKYRQNNTGVGIEYKLDSDISMLFGYYNNSIHRESVYLGETYTPNRVGAIRLGIMGAITTGYSRVPPMVPIAGLWASYDYRGVGVSLMWLPTVVAAVQLKVRVF